MFDRVAVGLLGHIPPLRNKKSILFSYNPNMTLAHLFVQALGGSRPLPKEQEVMKNLLSTAHDYIESLKSKTKANLTESIDSYVKEARAKGEAPTEKEIRDRITNSLVVAGKHLKTISEAESTKTRNMGKLMNIARAGASTGESDPNVFFVVVRDQQTCEECLRLHMMPDKVTPKVWKMSELKYSYHKKGEDLPSVAGLHPHCFTGDTLLYTSEGVFAFEELFKTQKNVMVTVDKRVVNRKSPSNQFGKAIPGEVWLNRHESGSKFMEATTVYDTGVQECYEIELESGHTLKVSEGHEMWVDDDGMGKKVRAVDLKVGDKIPLLSGESGFGKDNFEDLAELMGNLMGDGVMGETAQWNFFGEDIPYGENLLQKAKNFLSDYSKESFKKISEHLRIFPPNEKYSVPRATFNSTVLANIFKEEFGLSKKPKRVPKKLWTADKKTVSAFLRGLYAADGHSELSSVVLAQNDLEFLKEIQLLLANYGIVSRIFNHGSDQINKTITYANGDNFDTARKPCWRLVIGGNEQCELFSVEIGMGVKTKQDKLLSFIENGKQENKSRFFWRTTRVKSIKAIGKIQTYCLTEPMTNSVTANGIVTGNCRCTLTLLTPGFGFKNGMVSYISPDHNEYEKQKE